MRDFDQAYISERERYVMEQWNRGVGADSIAGVVGLNSAEEVRNMYKETERKLTAMLSLYGEKPSEQTVYQFLEEIGIHWSAWGAKELAFAIQLAMEKPELMEQMGDEFFPALGQQLNMAPGTVRTHMIHVLKQTYKERILSGQDVSFYEQLGKYGMYKLRISSFLESALSRINYFMCGGTCERNL